MRVFSKDKYIKDKELTGYCCDTSWINKCHMHTMKECNDMGYGIRSDWLIPCREVHRKAKEGEWVRIIKSDSGCNFTPGDIILCFNDKFLFSLFKNKTGISYGLYHELYLVREIIEEEEDMKNVKQLLKNGDMVITREGERYIFMKDYLGRDVFKSEDGTYCNLSRYDEDLTVGVDDAFTVMEIKQPKSFEALWFNECHYRTKWKREEVKEMTVAEIEKALGYSIKVVKEKK